MAQLLNDIDLLHELSQEGLCFIDTIQVDQFDRVLSSILVLRLFNFGAESDSKCLTEEKIINSRDHELLNNDNY